MSTWPVFADDERAAVDRVLASGRVNYWTGVEGRSFEHEFAEYAGVTHGVAVANGTVALELALHALDIGPGDDVVVPARTFIGTATAVVARGARPVVADIDRASGNVTADTISDALTPATRAVIPVHLAGWPCDMDAIMALAREKDLIVIEDCAQAHGARWNGRPVGTFGDAGAFSFCQDKIMTTAGEGGMLITGVEDVYRRAWEHKDHGRSMSAAAAAAAGEPGHEFKWIVESFGTNWRMTEVQAAIGRVQLRKLDEWVATRRRNASILDAGLSDVVGLRVPHAPEMAQHSYYKYHAYIEPDALTQDWTRRRILDEVNARGVKCMMGICPEIYREKAFVDAGFAPEAPLPVAVELGETSLMLLVDPTHTESDMEMAVETVREVMRLATGGA